MEGEHGQNQARHEARKPRDESLSLTGASRTAKNRYIFSLQPTFKGNHTVSLADQNMPGRLGFFLGGLLPPPTAGLPTGGASLSSSLHSQASFARTTPR